MKKKLFILYILISLNIYSEYKIGLCIMATGKYIKFVEPLVLSAKKFFLKNHNITYFIFTDGEIPKLNNIIKVKQSRLGWPYDTLMRFEIYYKNREILSQMDYLFACDADMLFVDKIDSEILGSLIATQHPGYINSRGTYETNSISTAYINSCEGKYYFAGGFYGGKATEFLKMSKIVSENIKKDSEKNYIAIWHDESHLNRYFIDNEPSVILSPSYCYPESWNLPFAKKLIALDKNHAELRN